MTPETYRHAFIAIHGWWGSGKTWIMHTSPGPRLIFDSEGGSEDVPVHQIPWDPIKHPKLPDGITPETSVVIDVQDFNHLQAGLALLRSGNHPFNSFGLDSLTENQKQIKTSVSDRDGGGYDPNAVFDQQAWGRLLNNGELMVRQMRDLTRKGAVKRMTGVVLMGSDTETLPAKPLLQGALRKSLAGFFDLEGYLFVAKTAEGQEVRVLQISPSDTAEAKCRLHLLKVKYGSHIENPNIQSMLDTINGGN